MESKQKWLTALAVFCMCIVVVTVVVCIVWFMNNEDDDEEVSESKSTSSSASTSSPKKLCADTNLLIDADKNCEDEYEKRVCPSTQCRPEETKRMCQCLISPDELSTLSFVGKTYVLGNRKITIRADGEVLVQDGPINNCFKSYVTKSTTINGNTRYGLGSSGYYENGNVFIYDGTSETGGYMVSTELTGSSFTPRSDCVNILRF